MPRGTPGKTYCTVYMSDELKTYLFDTAIKAEVKRTGDPSKGSASSFITVALREAINIRLKGGYLRAEDIPETCAELVDLRAKWTGDGR